VALLVLRTPLLLLVVVVFVLAAVAVALHRPLHFPLRGAVGAGGRALQLWWVAARGTHHVARIA
jgi:hypothetical protein